MITSLNPPDGAETTAEQTEMAFVPASERQHTIPSIADTVITVGKRSQQKKKRKRGPVSNGSDEDVFNYTAEPSLLDVGDMKRVGPVTKKRNKGERVWCCTESQR